MMKLKFYAIPAIICAIFAATAARAGWQYPGDYLGDGWYQDDGMRFIISVRGGASIRRGSVNNEISSLTNGYYVNPADNTVVSVAYYEDCVGEGLCTDYLYAGIGDISKLPAGKNFSAFSFAAGASIGWTVPNLPQWRTEIGWDHISASEYNASPLFEGDLELQGGQVSDVVAHVQSGGAHSSATTDIISAMAFYDFFDGIRKPVHEFIPYVGLGIGYSDTKTILNLSDLYGDLSLSVDLQNYGELDEYLVLQFYKSEHSNSNVAGLLALGFSYGLSENAFLDFGLRVAYVPKIKWVLSSEDGSRHRNWFSATNLIYTNLMLGVRFEF